jgi:hypothetical protein
MPRGGGVSSSVDFDFETDLGSLDPCAIGRYRAPASSFPLLSRLELPPPRPPPTMKPKSTILLTTAFSLLMCCSSIAQPDHADRKRQQRARAVERRKSREDRVKLAQLKSSSGITVVVQEEEEREEPEEPTPPSSSLQTLPSFDGGSTASHLREAVTYKTTFLDPCGALRLRALVESAGANRDVFLLYDKHWWSNASQRLADSIPGLTTQRQPSVVKKDKLETLGGRTSKASVPSWLTWVSKLNETRPGVYAHVWHLESGRGCAFA